MLSTFRRLANLTLVERALLLQLTALSLGLRVALTTITLPRLTSPCTVDRLFTLVDLATAVSHRNDRCLPRSLLLFWLLRARHESVELCLGVGKHNTTLEEHAWVERDGIILSFTSRYALFLRLSS